MENAMNWNDLLCDLRMNSDRSGEQEDARTEFERDFDRIVFCSSFRRLGKKTQVYPLPNNDHVHTRLAHSIEVACVGRSLGMLCGEIIKRKVNDLELFSDKEIIAITQIMQAACLAHDIGNPPFGHAGEFAIGAWFSASESACLLEEFDENQKDDFRHFNGNAQSFRILTRLEQHRLTDGMNITYATLATLLKYPWTTLDIRRKHKYCAFQSELDKLDDVSAKVGLRAIEKNRYCRHPLAYLVEAADDLCNMVLDLEDAIEMKLVSLEEILEIFSPLLNDDDDFNKIKTNKSMLPRKKMAYIRARSIGKAIKPLANAFEHAYDKIIKGFPCEDKDALILQAQSIGDVYREAERIKKDEVFHERRKIALEIGSYSVMSTLLNAFCHAVKEKVDKGPDKPISFKTERVLAFLRELAPNDKDSMYDAYHKVTDYISGMTDNYAKFIAAQISTLDE